MRHASRSPLLPSSGLIVLLAVVCAACAPVRSDSRPTAAANSPPPPGATAAAPPVWRVGDRWVYGWTSGTDSGTKTVDVLEPRLVKDVLYQVVRIGDVEHYHTPELHWVFAVRDSKVEARMIPPQPWFTWPLEVGRSWTHRGSFESSAGNRVSLDRFRVVAVEMVDVPAGRFQATKVIREGEGGDYDEYWYAAEVKWYVRWILRRGTVQVEERLARFEPAGGPPQGKPTDSPPPSR